MITLEDILENGDLVRKLKKWFKEHPTQERLAYIDFVTKSEIVIDVMQLGNGVHHVDH